MQNIKNLEKEERIGKTKGYKGVIALLSVLATMCIDQFVLDIPFANVVFPLLVVCAASMSAIKNFVIVAIYSVIFELSCIDWNPADLFRVHFWLLEVFIGFMMPFALYKVLNRKHKNISVFSYAAIASLSELLYFWASIVATVILWKVDPIAYILSDLPYEALGALATFVCAVPVAAIYKLTTEELTLRKKACENVNL